MLIATSVLLALHVDALVLPPCAEPLAPTREEGAPTSSAPTYWTFFIIIPFAL
jgi:hypothetical protein